MKKIILGALTSFFLLAGCNNSTESKPVDTQKTAAEETTKSTKNENKQDTNPKKTEEVLSPTNQSTKDFITPLLVKSETPADIMTIQIQEDMKQKLEEINKKMKEGLSGNIAKAFIQSKLTILLMVAFLLIGGYSTMLIPREEEPQIDVPMADIFLRYPGASPKEVEARVTQPLEKIISNVKGVEYVYSTSMKGQAMLIVQFYVVEDV